MEKNLQRPRIGVGVILLKDDQVLLGKRKSTLGTGDWSFAGGHLEFGEEIIECAKRELLEEVGVKAVSWKLGPWVEDIFENKHYVTFFVFVDEYVGEVQLLEPDKCEGWNWFSWEALPSPLFPPILSLFKKVDFEKFSHSLFELKL